jgi:predicted amidohydrolase
MSETSGTELVRVAALQIEVPDAESPAERLLRVTTKIAALPDIDLILLPEIWNVGYFNFDCYALDAEAAAGETATALAAAARGKGAYLLAGSIVERDGDNLFNLSLLFDRNGELVASYRKIHLFGYGSAETQVLTPGREVVTATTGIGTIGLSTCYDLRFPELYRQQVEQGAEYFLVVSAWPFPRLHHWVTLNHARAIENQAYLVSCNCAGMNQGRHYLGHSMVTDPWGTTVAATAERPDVLMATIDRRVVRECRAEFPALHDRVLGRA